MDRQVAGDVPLRDLTGVLIVPITHVHETKLGVNRNSRDRVEHVHELFIENAFSFPFSNIVLRFGTMHTVRLSIEEGKTVLILPPIVSDLQRFPSLHGISFIGVAGVPGSFESSTGVCRLKQWKRQSSTVLS